MFLKLASKQCCNFSSTGPMKISNYCWEGRGKNGICLLVDNKPCSWFINAVLPVHPKYLQEWQRLYPAVDLKQILRCECGKSFKPRSNRQRFCSDCQDGNRKKILREAKRRERVRKGSGVIL